MAKEQVQLQLSQTNGVAALQSLSNADYYQELVSRTGISREQINLILESNRENEELKTKAQIAQIERRFEDVNEFRLGISVQKHEKGFRITSVEPGGPATKLTDSDEILFSLETGDIVTKINGETPDSVDEFGFLISQSPRELQLTVVDKNTGQPLELVGKAKLSF